MATITTLNSGDSGPVSRGVINTNFTNLNSDKLETSVLDTDTTLAANSDAKVATQKAVKTYVDTEVAGLSKVRVRAYKSGGNQQIDNSYEKVLFESESYDLGDNFASSTLTAPRNGYYLIQANGDGDSNSSDSDRAVSIAIYKDGVIYSSATTPKTAATGVVSGAAISDVLYLTANQTIEIYAKCVSGSSVDFFSGEQYTFINIIEL